MPRGRKLAPIRKPTQRETIAIFAARVEEATPKWLDDYEARRVSLLGAFEELTRRIQGDPDTSDLVKLTAQLAMVHQRLTESEGTMMRFTAIREQIAMSKGVSHFADRDSGTTNNYQLNFSPGMTPEERLSAERIFLAMQSGKEIEALPPATKVIEAQVA